MSFTAQEVIDRARVLLNDTRSVKRYSSAQMLGFFNDAMRRLFTLRPDAFQVSVEQAITSNSSQQILPQDQVFLGVAYVTEDPSSEVYRVVREVSWEDFTNAQTTWIGGTPGIPTKFVKSRHNPREYFLSPRPQTGIVISLFVGMSPAANPVESLDAAQQYPARWYMPALIDCVVFLASSVDDEHINSGRAKMFYDSFLNQIGAGAQVLRTNSLGPLANSQEMRNDAQ